MNDVRPDGAAGREDVPGRIDDRRRPDRVVDQAVDQDVGAGRVLDVDERGRDAPLDVEVDVHSALEVDDRGRGTVVDRDPVDLQGLRGLVEDPDLFERVAELPRRAGAAAVDLVRAEEDVARTRVDDVVDVDRAVHDMAARPRGVAARDVVDARLDRRQVAAAVDVDLRRAAGEDQDVGVELHAAVLVRAVLRLVTASACKRPLAVVTVRVGVHGPVRDVDEEGEMVVAGGAGLREDAGIVPRSGRDSSAAGAFDLRVQRRVVVCVRRDVAEEARRSRERVREVVNVLEASLQVHAFEARDQCVRVDEDVRVERVVRVGCRSPHRTPRCAS